MNRFELRDLLWQAVPTTQRCFQKEAHGDCIRHAAEAVNGDLLRQL